jgi:predicted acyltransferase
MSTTARSTGGAEIALVPPRRERIVALDAHRGLALVMLLLVNTAGIRSALPYHLGHPEWHGLTFADTFFPVFLFAMGAAMEFSTRAQRAALVLRRVVLLFAIGVGIAWVRNGEPRVTGILQKIAVAYLLAWLVMRLPKRAHLVVAVAIVGAMWAAATWLAPAGVVAGSWEPGTNIVNWIDRMVIGRPATEGFATAVMAAVNVLGGALVIRSVRGLDARRALRRIALWAAAGIALGLLVALAVPVNKRIWTPSFTVLAHGIACAYLALFWWTTEIRRWRPPVRPLVALGRNPIFIYVLFTVAHEALRPVRDPLMDQVAGVVGPLPASLLWSAALLGIAWALSGWMDRRKMYVRV